MRTLIERLFLARGCKEDYGNHSLHVCVNVHESVDGRFIVKHDYEAFNKCFPLGAMQFSNAFGTKNQLRTISNC